MAKNKATVKMPPIEQLRGRTLGRILIKMGVLSREQIHECMKIQNERQGKVQIGQMSGRERCRSVKSCLNLV